MDFTEVENGLSSTDEEQVKSALAKLKTHTEAMDAQVTKQVVPHCIDKLELADMEIRSGALSVLYTQISNGNENMDKYAADLIKTFSQAKILDVKFDKGDSEAYVSFHSNACHLICELQAKYAEKLGGCLKVLGNYIVECTGHENREIATSACDYWAKLQLPPVPPKLMDSWVPVVLKKLPHLVPTLVKNLIYHPEHVQALEQATQISPISDEMMDKLAPYSNLRNYAALGFENLCRIFQLEVFPIFKPLVEMWLVKSDDWTQQEAVVLALGAFMEAMGTPKELWEFYKSILPTLLSLYSHEKPLVRSIVCFTMQHFINAQIKNLKDPYPKMLKSSLQLLTDNSYEVQTMAMRSLGALLAYSDRDIQPQASKVIECLVKINPIIKGGLRYSYYECISHLVGRLGAVLDEADLKRLMQPLMDQWEKLKFDLSSPQAKEDTMMLCSPLCVIAIFSKSDFEPYTEPIISKIVQHTESVVDQSNGHGTGSKEDIAGCLVAYLDLLSAIFEGQGKKVVELGKKNKLTKLIIDLLKHPELKGLVHQSALALLGHLCNYCYEEVQDHIDDVLDIIENAMSMESDNVRNNALWALTFISKKIDTNNRKIVSLGKKLPPMIMNQNAEEGVIIFATLSATNLAIQFPKEIMSEIVRDDILQHICSLLQQEFPREDEKVSIFKNLCQILAQNLKAVKVPTWTQVCIAAAILTTTDEALTQMLKTLIRDVRTSLGNAGWNKVSQHMGAQLSYSLRKKYKLY